ncbi:hypothetical protein AB9Q04_04355 [Anaerococcus sp. ENR1011]|uniref:Uncharacterized protein n=1 Tax=Anaerococcus groningensis TaxID=3115616 RepID=A0ABW9N0X5_9FIRM
MKDLVEIYSSDQDSFAVGYIIYQSEDRLFTHLVDDQGKFDGYLLFDKKTIDGIEKNTEYLQKIETYMGFWGNISIGDSDNEIYQSKPDFIDLIKYAKDHNKIITLATSFNYYDISTGYVNSYNDDIVVIDAINKANAEIFDQFEIPIDELITLEIESIDNFLLGYANKKS